MVSESLVDAAARVADGESLDWGSMTSRLSTEDERAVAEELAALEKIANEHRRLHHLLPDPGASKGQRDAAGSSWGHLELVEVLGRGSYGTVYRAWDTRLERHVALKLFHRVRDAEQVMREGRMLARIRHDNVVAVHGADWIDGAAGIWMDCIRGRTLEQIVREQGPMSAREATLVGVDLARALAAVHGADLLHCDIKAQNVIREPGGRLVLMDLGAGRALAPLNLDALTSEDLIGTPRYMAPELFQHRATSRQSDFYSLGVLLYFLVTGKFPVDGKSLSEIRWAHADGRRTRLRDVRADLPTAFIAEVEKALAIDPLERHPSAGALEGALLRLLVSAPGLGPVVEPARPLAAPAEAAITPRPAISRRGWIALAVTGAVVAALVAGWQSGGGPSFGGARTIAVLPIRNLTGDPAKSYIADGLTEVLISNLARVRSLSVPSLSAVTPYRDSNQSTRAIADNLGANVLLAGSIIQVGDVVRIGVQLIDPGTDKVSWSQELTKPAAELLAAQGEIARLVAAKLSIDLSSAEVSALRQPALQPEAQDAYLRGLVASENVLDLRGANAALAHLRRATALEPSFAEAWGQQALAELRLIELEAGVNRAERAARVKGLATKSIELDPTLSTGYLALGYAQFNHDWDFAAAEQTFRTGLQHAPSSAVTMQGLAVLLASLGRFPEAIEVAERACEVERLVPARRALLGVIQYYARNYTQAEVELRRALDIMPAFPAGHFGLGYVFAAQGRYAEAIAELEESIGKVRRPSYVVELARVHTAAGHPAEASKLLNELAERRSKGEGFSLDNLAYVAAAAGKTDEAFGILNEAINERLSNILWAAVDPRLDPLRQDPRFPGMLQRIGLRP